MKFVCYFSPSLFPISSLLPFFSFIYFYSPPFPLSPFPPLPPSSTALIIQDRALCADGSLFYPPVRPFFFFFFFSLFPQFPPTSPHPPIPQSPDHPYRKNLTPNLGSEGIQHIYFNRTLPETPYPSIFPTFFGNLIEVNGVLWPRKTIKVCVFLFFVPFSLSSYCYKQIEKNLSI